MAEVRVRGAGREDQVVVRDRIGARDGDRAADRIDRANVGEEDFDVLLLSQHPADRRCDVARRQRRGGHLIQQRLKQMVVVAIEQRRANIRACERARCVQSAETTTDDDDARGVQSSEFTVQSYGSRSVAVHVQGSGSRSGSGFSVSGSSDIVTVCRISRENSIPRLAKLSSEGRRRSSRRRVRSIVPTRAASPSRCSTGE